MEVIQLTAQGDLSEGIDEVDALAGSLSELDKMAESFSLDLFEDEIKEAAAAAKAAKTTVLSLDEAIRNQGKAAIDAAKQGNSFLDYLKKEAELARKASRETKELISDLRSLSKASVASRHRDVFAEARSANLVQGSVPLPATALKASGAAARGAKRDFGALATQFRDMDGVGLRLGDTIDQLGVALSGGLGAAIASGIALFAAHKAAVSAVISVYETYIEKSNMGAKAADRLKTALEDVQVALVESANGTEDVNDVMGGATELLDLMTESLNSDSEAWRVFWDTLRDGAAVFGIINPPLMLMLGVVEALQIANNLLSTSNMALAESLRTVAEAAADAASNLKDAATSFIEARIEGFGKVLKDMTSPKKGGGGGGRKKEIDIIRDLTKARIKELEVVRELRRLQETGTLSEVNRELEKAEKAHLKVADSIRLYAMELETARNPRTRRALQLEIEGLEQEEAKLRDNVKLLKERRDELRGIAEEIENTARALAGTLQATDDLDKSLKEAMGKIEDIENLRNEASNNFGLDFAMGLQEQLDALNLDPISRMALEFELLGRAIDGVVNTSLSMLVEGLANIAGEMFNTFGQMAVGAATTEDLINGILGGFGDLASEIGQFYILQGAAMMFMPGGFGAGLAMMIAGAALQTFGGALSGAASGGAAPSTSASSGGGGVGARAQLQGQNQGGTIIHLSAKFGTTEIQGEVEGMVNDGVQSNRIQAQSTGRRRVA